MRGAIPPPPIRLHGVVLSSAQGKLYFTFYIPNYVMRKKERRIHIKTSFWKQNNG
jgi:hypothetical protein